MPATLTEGQFLQLELERLKNRKSNVDNAILAQNRQIDLNESYRKRYAKYVQILFVLIFAYIGYLAIITIQNMFPDIPSMVFDGLLLLLIVIVAYYIFYAVMELITRSNMNYDELGSVDTTTPNNSDPNALRNAGKLAQSNTASGVCVGQECCPASYKWDSATNRCVQIQTFTNMDAVAPYESAGYSLY
jgi:hypothetical protein